VIEPDVERAIDFLCTVFGNALEGWVNLFTVEHGTGVRKTAWAPVEIIDELAPAIQSFGRVGDVWFGCALRKGMLPNGQRGREADCLSIPGLWLDVDVAGPGHRLPGLVQSYEEARLFINRFQYPPDAVVRSGHGFQCWWLFAETLDAVDAPAYLARWRATWLKLAANAGIHLDDVWDLPRVMRLPGTYNFKDREPVLVTGKWRR
jgi:hypothetical protein